MSAIPYPKRSERRLTVAQAVLCVVSAFVCAQLAARLVADAVAASTPFASRVGDTGHGAAEIVASMLASELVLIAFSLGGPLLLALPLRGALSLEPARAEVFVAAAAGTVLLGPAGDALMQLLSEALPALSLGVVPALHEAARAVPPLLLWPAFALGPGLAEELLFRGVLQGALGRSAAAVWLSGASFALFHVDPVHVIGVLPLGLFLAWCARRSGTLVSIVAHVANNSVALVALHSGALDTGYGTTTPVPWPVLALSLCGVALCAHRIHRATPGA